MNPIKAQRTWNTLSTKWINATPFGRGKPARNSRRKQRSYGKVKKGTLTNFIPVQVVNAITGEITKGYMRELSKRRLRKWLGFHNYRAQVELVSLKLYATFRHLDQEELKEFPILIKLDNYQVPYLIDHAHSYLTAKGKYTATFDLRTVDNLKYLEIIAARKTDVMKLFNKIKKDKKHK